MLPWARWLSDFDSTKVMWKTVSCSATSPPFSVGNNIVVCLSSSLGVNNKSQVDIHLAVFNDKRSSKSATSLSHSHSLTNWYTGYMHDDQ